MTLPSAWTELRHHPKQSQLWRSQSRFIAVAAGRGSGKTELARRKIVKSLKKTDSLYAYCLPTYKQAKRVAWRYIKNLVPKEWLKGDPNETELRIDTVFGSQLYVVGMDKPQRIEGDQWDGVVLDESCDQKPGTFGLSVLPALSHRFGWCWRIGVPKRAGIGAAEFKHFYFNDAEESYTWPSEDILAPEQLRYARENLDAKDYNEQYLAKWETASGAIFYSFDESLNTRSDVNYQPSLKVIVGSDFNVDPMAWVLCHQIGNELQVFDELFISNTNTRETLDRLHSKYGNHEAGWIFIGDATSKARNTRASESDYIQIKNDKRFRRATVSYPSRNPNIANRFAACNALFCNADGIRRCFISPRCVNLIWDLNSRAYTPGTSEPNDYGNIGHISDALGYVIHRLYPIRHYHKYDARVYVGN